MELLKIKCICSCHTPGTRMIHMQACCNDGWIEVPILKPKKDEA